MMQKKSNLTKLKASKDNNLHTNMDFRPTSQYSLLSESQSLQLKYDYHMQEKALDFLH